jgi:hypothetical protein
MKRSLFAELQRRNVIRAAVLYIGAVWALAQGISQLGPSVGLPDWTTRWFLVAAVIGLSAPQGKAQRQSSTMQQFNDLRHSQMIQCAATTKLNGHKFKTEQPLMIKRLRRLSGCCQARGALSAQRAFAV